MGHPMPGNQVKDWKVYHECMKDKADTSENKGYCARVANAVANKTIRHSFTPQELKDLVRFGVEQAYKENPTWDS
jgi:hypothetical protein